MDNSSLIEYFTQCVEYADSWIKDAESRDDWGDVFYYQGQKYLAQKAIAMLGGKIGG